MQEPEKKPCFNCGALTNYHVYPSERGEPRIIYCCEECEEELNK